MTGRRRRERGKKKRPGAGKESPGSSLRRRTHADGKRFGRLWSRGFLVLRADFPRKKTRAGSRMGVVGSVSSEPWESDCLLLRALSLA